MVRRLVLGCGLLAMLSVFGCAGSAAVAATPSFDAHGSVEQVYATGLEPGAPVTVSDGEGSEVASKSADGLGGVLFREVAPGDGYRVASGGETSEPLSVLTTDRRRPARPSTASRSPRAATAT